MPNKIAVATLDGRAYYKITKILRDIDVKFDNLTPKEIPNSNIKLVITTEKERNLINFEQIISVEELDDDLYLVEEKLLKFLYNDIEDSIIIGIDPGKRIGIAVFFGQKKVIGEVLNVEEDVIEKILKIIKNSKAKKKIIRIGNGEPKFALHMANFLSKHLKNVTIELVDESGTSSIPKKQKSKLAKDQISAMTIALRQGKKYVRKE